MRAGSRAYLELREDIVSGRLAPGTPVGEVELAAHLGLSRTPVREALARLTADGLVRTLSPRSSVVADISATDVRELFHLRIAVECALARLAARRRDAEAFARVSEQIEGARELDLADAHAQDAYQEVVAALDAAIVAAAASDYLARSLDGVRLHVRRLRRLSRDHAGRLRRSVEEHLAIARAITEGDETLAEAATTVHLHNSLRHILASYFHTDREGTPDADHP